MPILYNTDFIDRDIMIAIARGAVDGVTSHHISGHNADVGSSLETIWGEGGVITHPAAATVLKISSSSTADDLGSTGLEKLIIIGLNANYHEIQEEVILNGQTAVNTVKEYLRIFHLRGTQAGSGLSNAGIVYAGTGDITTGKPAVVHAHMAIGLSHSLAAVFTIPGDHEGLLIAHRQYSSVSKNVEAYFCVREYEGIFHAEDVLVYTVGEVDEIYSPPLLLPPRMDIEVRAKAAAGGGDIAAAMSVLLVPPEAAHELNGLLGVHVEPLGDRR